jgi:colanic acid biosynthesis glycosyl transferase WcaI
MVSAWIHSGVDATLFVPTAVSERRAVHQAAYLAHAAIHMIRNGGPGKSVITVDVPTGLGLAGWLAGRFTGVRHTMLVMDLYQFQTAGSWAGRLRRKVDVASLRAAQSVVTLGTCMAEVIRQKAHISADVLPIWQDTDALEAVDSSALRSTLGIRPDETVFLYSGHAGPQHPLGPIIQAFESLPKSEARLVIAGRGSQIDAIRGQTETLQKVLLVDAVPSNQVSELLSLGDVHVVSLSESATGTCVPSKAYAAMCVSRPILYVGSPSGQAAIDVSTFEAGKVVRSDVDAIKAAVLSFLLPSTDLDAMGARGREMVVADRDSRVQAARFLTILR